jgi:hypothetical protein
MLANSIFRDSDSSTSGDKGIFGAFAPAFRLYVARGSKAGGWAGQHGSREYRRDPECLRQERWEERLDAVTQAVEEVTNAAQTCRERREKNQPESVSNEWVKWRANVFFDAAGLTTLSYYVVINGQPPRHKLQSFIHDRNTPSKASTSLLKGEKV